MKKRFVAFLLVVSLVLSVFAVAPVSAASSFKNVKSFKSGAKIDLYKGGKKETVKYGNYKNDSDTYGIKNSMVITVNSKRFKLTCPGLYEFGKVYYGDINKKDKYIELFVRMSDDFSGEYCMILRYKGGKLYKCSIQSYNYEEKKYEKNSQRVYTNMGWGLPKVDGKGAVTLAQTDSALGGCFVYRSRYTLDKSSFKLKEKPVSYVVCGKSMTGPAERTFKAYSSKSFKASKFTVKKGQTVRILRVYKNHWIYIKTQSGKTGWLFRPLDDAATYPNDFDVILKGLPVWS